MADLTKKLLNFAWPGGIGITVSSGGIQIVSRTPSESDKAEAWLDLRELAKELIALAPAVFQKSNQAFLDSTVPLDSDPLYLRSKAIVLANLAKELSERTFCLTGKFSLASKDEFARRLTLVGSLVWEDAGYSEDYLVVAARKDPRTHVSGLTKKTTTALLNRCAYGSPLIVSEGTLWLCLNFRS